MIQFTLSFVQIFWDMILNEIEAPIIARVAQPGQFVILRANERGERVPMTAADTNPEKGAITVIFSVLGRSTALFKALQEGDSYQNVAQVQDFRGDSPI
jgi:ferredoxin--NADP+ reductase